MFFVLVRVKMDIIDIAGSNVYAPDLPDKGPELAVFNLSGK